MNTDIVGFGNSDTLEIWVDEYWIIEMIYFDMTYCGT